MKKLISIALIVGIVGLLVGFVVMGTDVSASDTPCSDLWGACLEQGHSYAQCNDLFKICLDIMYPLQ